MARRATNVAIQVEYVSTDNYKRATNVAAQIEHVDIDNYRRATNVAAQIEFAPLIITNKYNIRWQMTG